METALKDEIETLKFKNATLQGQFNDSKVLNDENVNLRAEVKSLRKQHKSLRSSYRQQRASFNTSFELMDQHRKALHQISPAFCNGNDENASSDEDDDYRTDGICESELLLSMLDLVLHPFA